MGFIDGFTQPWSIWISFLCSYRLGMYLGIASVIMLTCFVVGGAAIIVNRIIERLQKGR